LTLFSFSSENWTRPPEEVTYLMGLLRLFVRRDVAELDRQGVRIKVIGAREGLQTDIAASLDEAVAKTKDNTGLVLTLAFNYGGRQEITTAVQAIAAKVARGEIDPNGVDSFTVEQHLSTFGMPDPDLLIRTSGEQRISNFLLWQCAYTEFVFAPVMWPDFDETAFDEALATYASRDRRFGGVKAR
jgi:undecaprenyl diphosphate synthase